MISQNPLEQYQIGPSLYQSAVGHGMMAPQGHMQQQQQPQQIQPQHQRQMPDWFKAQAGSGYQQGAIPPYQQTNNQNNQLVGGISNAGTPQASGTQQVPSGPIQAPVVSSGPITPTVSSVQPNGVQNWFGLNPAAGQQPQQPQASGGIQPHLGSMSACWSMNHNDLQIPQASGGVQPQQPGVCLAQQYPALFGKTPHSCLPALNADYAKSQQELASGKVGIGLQ